MKRLLFLMFGFFLLSTLHAQDMKVKDDKVKMKSKGDAKNMMPMPYTPTYSSDFSIGNRNYSKMIMEVWKDWDDNQLERHDYFADSLEMFFADGTTVKGAKENLAAAKQYRATMSGVSSTIHAFVPLRVNDKGEDVVAVWGEEENTMVDGKKEKRSIHEVWWFNKDGKISILRQWAAVVK